MHLALSSQKHRKSICLNGLRFTSAILAVSSKCTKQKKHLGGYPVLKAFLVAALVTVVVAILTTVLLNFLVDSPQSTAEITASSKGFEWRATGRIAAFILVFFIIVSNIRKFFDRLNG